MTENKQLAKKIIYAFMYVLMSIQIVLGCCFAVCNFTTVPGFAETGEYVEISKTFVLDEYVGILYPALIALCRAVQTISRIPYQCLLYVLQLGAAYGSGCFLCSGFLKAEEKQNNRRKMIVGALYLMTVPMILQCHMAVLPYSLALSGMCMMTGLLVRVFQGKRKADSRFMLQTALLWGGLALCLPDYLYLAGVAVAGSLIMVIVGHCRKADRKKEIGMSLLIVVAAAVVIHGTNIVTQTPGSRGRIQRTAGAAMLSRVVWPNFGQNYYFWSDEVKDIMDEETAKVISRYPEEVTYIAGPLFEQAVGKKRADFLYWQMAKRCLGDSTRQVAGDITMDFLQYVCVPISVWQNLQGRGISETGWNYRHFKMQCPALSRYYLNFSFWAWCLCLAAGAGLRLVYRKQKGTDRKRMVIGTVLIASLGLLQVLWYTLYRSASMDYKKVLFATLLWYLAVWIPADEEGRAEQPAKGTVWFLTGLLGIGVLVGIAVGAEKGHERYREQYWQKMLEEKETVEIVCFGDSIWDLVRDDTGIAAVLEEKLKATVYNCAIMGTSAAYFPETDEEADKWNPKNLPSLMAWIENPDQAALPKGVLKKTKLKKIDWQSVDYVLLAYGLNDYFKGLPREGEDAYDIYTYAGALRNSIKILQKKCPQAQIVICSPTYCQLYSYGKVVDDSNTLDYGGGTGIDYVQTAEKVASEYGLLFVNNYRDLGIHRFNGPKYLEDATHLTKTGRSKYAGNLARRLQEQAVQARK